jgi:flavodoxin
LTNYNIETVQCVYFSPTGTTRRTVNAIAEGTGLRVADPIDITLPAPREGWDGSTQGDILLVGVPVYSGTIPSHPREPLHRLEGTGRWAVPVAARAAR